MCTYPGLRTFSFLGVEGLVAYTNKPLSLPLSLPVYLSASFCVYICLSVCLLRDRLVRLVVKISASREDNLEFESTLRRDFPSSSHTSGLKTGTPVATLSDTWRYMVNLGLVGPVSVYRDWVRWKFYLSVAAHKLV